MASSSDEEEQFNSNKTREEIEEEENFLNEIAAFLQEIGKRIVKKFPPRISYTKITFTTLYRLVTGYGGYFACNELRLWPDILETLGIPCPVVKNCVQTLCMHYRRYLLDYEKVYFHGRPISSVLSSVPVDPDDRPVKKPTLPLPKNRSQYYDDINMEEDYSNDSMLDEEEEKSPRPKKEQKSISSVLKPTTFSTANTPIQNLVTSNGSDNIFSSNGASNIKTSQAFLPQSQLTSTPSIPSSMLKVTPLTLMQQQQQKQARVGGVSSLLPTGTTSLPNYSKPALPTRLQQQLPSTFVAAKMEFPYYERKRNFQNLKELTLVRRLNCSIQAHQYLDIHRLRQTLLSLHAVLVQRPFFSMDNIDKLGMDFLLSQLEEFLKSYEFYDPRLSRYNLHTKEEILKGENYLLVLQCIIDISALLWITDSDFTSTTPPQYRGIPLKLLFSNDQKLLQLLVEILRKKEAEKMPVEYTERILEILMNLGKFIKLVGTSQQPEDYCAPLLSVLMKMCFVGGIYTLKALEILIMIFSAADKNNMEQFQKVLTRKDIEKLWSIFADDDDFDVCESAMHLLVSFGKHWSQDYKKEVFF